MIGPTTVNYIQDGISDGDLMVLLKNKLGYINWHSMDTGMIDLLADCRDQNYSVIFTGEIIYQNKNGLGYKLLKSYNDISK